MKIGIEAQRLFRKKKHGMDIVALELIRSLAEIDRENQYCIFAKDDEDNKIIEESANVQVVKIKGGPYPYWEQVLLPREVKRHGVELLHCTANTAPLTIDIPLVITVHDIIYLEKWNFSKGSWYQIAGNLYRRWNVPPAVRKAVKILTVSAFERDRIQEFFLLPEEKIDFLYNGVSDHFRKISDPETLAAIRKKYELPESYIFFLGNTDPKKNVRGVLSALSRLRKAGVLSHKLLMLDIDRTYLSRVATEIGDPEILAFIAFTGYVSNEELPAIYSMASVFLYPSLRESFGIPILEAMACETPVITSQTSSMPEVAGSAALLVDPNSPESIAEAIQKLLNDEKLCDDLRQKGLSRSREFSWKENAMKTLAVYQSLLAESAKRVR
jgi:glycosyltransferase involved in cell wall biosynthesis